MQVPSFPSLPMIDWLQSHLGMSPQLQTRLLVTVGTIVGLWLVRHFVLGLVYRRGGGPRGRGRWRQGGAHPRGAAGGGPFGPTRGVGGRPPPEGRGDTRTPLPHPKHTARFF